ncbi:PLP-dependent aminotransferase family protein [Silvibacterium dinghuense]|uniref:PLP-dependent aminotransferase family protein n=1 Tax=Silvibacterium dinghuense TaxID=1560006 RepID=A0A4Q1SCE6_9BACT|nr:PLP-dependent aminotransferase family protein [Silvibacterium dinghuense]RXS94894.1 PLP-dependent aminotransferase family protein [Silvibacterium dinghuense]GGH08789.1 transcriptional regulator [Silvibacterium dinghuense]
MKGFEHLDLDRDHRRTLQTQLTEQLKVMVQQGELRPAERLPSTRALADELRISRNTVVAAYEQLESEGYLQAHERSAFTVGAAARAFARPRQGDAKPGQRVVGPPRTLIAPRPFRPAQPDIHLFSLKTWNRHRTRVLREALLLQYQSRFSMGLDVLRQNVGAYLQESRGIRCYWDEIVITGGSQQALFMVGQLLLDSGSSVYMEDPGFPGAIRAWQQTGATIVPAPVDEEGICLPLPMAEQAKVVYATPSHQFPLGVCMSLARRLELLRVARERELWVVEDDYDSEFRYNSAPQPSLQSLDEHRRVIYVGSFSKTLFPGLRLGYMVLPPQLVERFARLKATLEDHGPLIDQATLASFLESGAFDSHLRRCRRIYRERQQLFLDLVSRKGLPLRFPVTGRGMNLAGHFVMETDDARVGAALEREGVDTPALSSYCSQARCSGLLFGLTAFTDAEIRMGIEMLANTLVRSVEHKRGR